MSEELVRDSSCTALRSFKLVANQPCSLTLALFRLEYHFKLIHSKFKLVTQQAANMYVPVLVAVLVAQVQQLTGASDWSLPAAAANGWCQCVVVGRIGVHSVAPPTGNCFTVPGPSHCGTGQPPPSSWGLGSVLNTVMIRNTNGTSSQPASE